MCVPIASELCECVYFRLYLCPMSHIHSPNKQTNSHSHIEKDKPYMPIKSFWNLFGIILWVLLLQLLMLLLQLLMLLLSFLYRTKIVRDFVQCRLLLAETDDWNQMRKKNVATNFQRKFIVCHVDLSIEKSTPLHPIKWLLQRKHCGHGEIVPTISL